MKKVRALLREVLRRNFLSADPGAGVVFPRRHPPTAALVSTEGHFLLQRERKAPGIEMASAREGSYTSGKDEFKHAKTLCCILSL